MTTTATTATPTTAATPFAPGSVSLGLYLETGDPIAAVRELERQAGLALAAGFDGVTLPEHHGTQPGYVTNPVLVATHLLGRLDHGWVAAAPTLASLRPAPLLAEDIAWAALLSGARFGVAFGAGYDARDFAVTGTPFATRQQRFRTVTAEIADRLRPVGADGADGAEGDSGIRFARRTTVPLLVATKGPRNVDHAARIGAGLLLPPVPEVEAAALAERYRAADGTGPVTVTRWVWLGDHPAEGERALNARASGAQGDRLWQDAGSTIRVESATDRAVLARRLSDVLVASGGTNLNLRVHLPGIDAAATAEQIGLVGRVVQAVSEIGRVATVADQRITEGPRG